MYIDPQNCSRRHNGVSMGSLVAIAASLFPGYGESADVSVNIQLDETFVEVIRGIRRAEGIDPPDTAADRRLYQALERIHSQPGSIGAPARPGPQPAPVVVRDGFQHISY
jgi:hypothetical protein